MKNKENHSARASVLFSIQAQERIFFKQTILYRRSVDSTHREHPERSDNSRDDWTSLFDGSKWNSLLTDPRSSIAAC